MSEPIPPAPPTGYPLTTTFTLPDRIARWRPFVHWLLVIPHYIVWYVLNLVTGLVVLIGWFAGVFAGKVPEFVLQFVALSLRYQTRFFSYALFLRESYPPFDFDLKLEDNGKDAAVAVSLVPQVEGRSRLTIFFRLLLVIPHYIVLTILGLVLYVVLFIGWFAVIILGRWPDGLRSFVLGFVRWSNRVGAYFNLATDEYPPFSLQ